MKGSSSGTNPKPPFSLKDDTPEASLLEKYRTSNLVFSDTKHCRIVQTFRDNNNYVKTKLPKLPGRYFPKYTSKLIYLSFND
jgi:hypothetical protein